MLFAVLEQVSGECSDLWLQVHRTAGLEHLGLGPATALLTLQGTGPLPKMELTGRQELRQLTTHAMLLMLTGLLCIEAPSGDYTRVDAVSGATRFITPAAHQSNILEAVYWNHIVGCRGCMQHCITLSYNARVLMRQGRMCKY